MAAGSQNIDGQATPAGMYGVYVIAVHALDLDALPALIDGKPITAIAPHQHDDDRFYVTTEHPEALGFAPFEIINTAAGQRPAVHGGHVLERLK